MPGKHREGDRPVTLWLNPADYLLLERLAAAESLSRPKLLLKLLKEAGKAETLAALAARVAALESARLPPAKSERE
jgi:hypothetical protein